jgi:uncharacterized repeat protein (TIGR02543 family)
MSEKNKCIIDGKSIFTLLLMCALFAACTLYPIKDIVDKAKGAGIPHFTVTFDVGGGVEGDIPDQPAPQDVEKNGKVALPAHPTKVDLDDDTITVQTFGWWYKENPYFDPAPSDLTPWDFENDTVTEDITLYARWNDPGKHTVVFFDTEDTFGTPPIKKYAITSVNDNATFNSLSIPTSTKDGYILEGWIMDDGTPVENTFVITESIAVYAKWKPIITWTVSYDTTTSTMLKFTFSAGVDLDVSDITIANNIEADEVGAATKGVLIGFGTSWKLVITVAAEGSISVVIDKYGVDPTPHNVDVFDKWASYENEAAVKTAISNEDIIYWVTGGVLSSVLPQEKKLNEHGVSGGTPVKTHLYYIDASGSLSLTRPAGWTVSTTSNVGTITIITLGYNNGGGVTASYELWLVGVAEFVVIFEPGTSGTVTIKDDEVTSNGDSTDFPTNGKCIGMPGTTAITLDDDGTGFTLTVYEGDPSNNTTVTLDATGKFMADSNIYTVVVSVAP